METEKFLTEHYGPLLSLEQIAALFKRSPNGLRVGMHANTAFAARMRAARVKLGRRLYFRAADIARLIDSGE